MHELSIALAIVDGVLEESARRGGVAVETVRVRVGRVAGVDCDALRFAWQVASEGTPVASSRLEIAEVAAVLVCRNCGEQPSDRTLICPACGSFETRLLRGAELEIESLEIVDEPTAAG